MVPSFDNSRPRHAALFRAKTDRISIYSMYHLNRDAPTGQFDVVQHDLSMDSSLQEGLLNNSTCLQRNAAIVALDTYSVTYSTCGGGDNPALSLPVCLPSESPHLVSVEPRLNRDNRPISSLSSFSGKSGCSLSWSVCICVLLLQSLTFLVPTPPLPTKAFRRCLSLALRYIRLDRKSRSGASSFSLPHGMVRFRLSANE
ncbi:hypothetical protein V8C26DRAFT_16661 [Trichoderma gracile]